MVEERALRASRNHTAEVDYVVVGLGALGSATAWQLASRGHSVVGLEQFELGHSRGASHDTSRILRHSYHTPGYVRLTCEAYDDWARLEAESGEQLVTVVGGLDLFPKDCAISPVDYVGSLRDVGIRFEELSAEEYAVLRKAGTERAFTGEYTDTETTGVYRCKACQAKLFESDTKFHSVCGWPSFYQPISDTIEYLEDNSHGMKRVEVRCANCGSHLGHVFPDGYGTPTGDRYCINSISLTLEPADPR